MPRTARLRLPGIPLHLIQRGVNRSVCFFTDNDRLVYLSLLKRLGSQFGVLTHAYVLMNNHVHLLLTPLERDSTSLMMKNLGQQYVQYVNRAHGRTGGLWEGRFRSNIVESGSYVMNCYRYVELNPVRAGMVKRPGDYPWSSFRVNANGEVSDLIVPQERYLRLAPTDIERQQAYRRYCGMPTRPNEIQEIRDAANGGFALGSPEFLGKLEEVLGTRVSRTRLPNPARISPQGTNELSGLSPNLWS